MSVDSQCLNRSPSTGISYSTTKDDFQFGLLRSAPGSRLPARGAPSQAATQHSSQPPGPASLFYTACSLNDIRECVRKLRGQMVGFEKQPQFRLRVGGLEGTFYEGQEELKEYCEVLYLPQPTKMEVVGTVDDVPCLAMGQQLIILVAESGEVYAYEEDTLHKVAKNMQEFTKIGLQRLGKEVYHCGEHIDSLDEAERDKDPIIQELRQSTQRFLEGGKEDFQRLLGLQ
ncbi:uncharacterized protein LOC122168190 [Centrocercus urophasianus]|uniref:uncharacterized protein LOC122168190 n=1 Tax=Centrocercus urophasianus TaxID=9002 RepID=UPI001C64A8A4|nr:uncharacterized protein LOC122168190 [Centrocercus urophasianus]